MKKGLLKNLFLSLVLVLFLIITAGFVSADVIINEIMYNPDLADDTDLEWIELYNTGTSTVNLADWTIDGSNFDDVNISANGYVVVAKELIDGGDLDTDSFEAYYGNNDSVWNSSDASYGAVDGSFTLGNTGYNTIDLTDGSTTMDFVNYSNSWGADGNNYTLEIINPSGGAGSNNWKQSTTVNGTPGAQNSVYDATGPTISNETIYPSTVYNDNDVTLNATIADTNGIDSVWIEGNWEGSTVVYTTGITNVSDVYSYVVDSGNFSNQEAVEWRYYANDTVGNSATGTLQSFTVQNREPTLITTIPNIVWPEDTTNTTDVHTHFSDDDLDTLTYCYTNTPTNIAITINQTSGVVTLTPDANFTGAEYINFTATDGIATTTSNGVMLNVTPVNDAPVITSTPATLTATEAVEYTYDVDATDIDSNVSQLVYSVLAPANATIDNSTGLLKWTPTAAQADAGVVAVEVKVTDPEASSKTQEFDVNVIHVLDIIDMKVNGVSVSDNDTIENIKPGDTLDVDFKVKNRFTEKVLVGITAQGDIALLNDLESTSYFNLNENSEKSISYTFNVPNLISLNNFTLNLSTGGQDLDVPANMYYSAKLINFNVNKTPHKIKITNKEFAKDNLTCDRSTTLKLNLTNTGQANENVTVSVYNANTNNNSNQTKAIAANSAEEYTFNINAENAGATENFIITVYYQFDYFSFSDSITLTTHDCFDVASLQNAIAVEEDVPPTWQIDLTNFTYGDTTGLVYTVVNESNTSLIDCSITGTLFSCLTPAANASGRSIVNMSITAGSTINYEIFNVDVTAVNDAPSISYIPNVAFDEDGYNDATDLDDYVSDIEDDDSAITWAVTGNTNVNVIIDSTTHIANITATADWNGAETITLIATDTAGLSANGTVTVTVNPVSDLPIISSYYPIQTNPRMAETTGSRLFNVSAYDPDGDSITYDWKMDGTTVSTTTSYTASSLNVGDYDIAVTVTDSNGNSTSHSWLLTVSDKPLTDNYYFSYGQTLENATNVIIGESTYGIIDFGNNTLNLLDAVDLDAYVNIAKGVIAIDTTNLRGLNSSAAITMKGLTFTQTPTIYYNEGYGATGNVECPADLCTNVVYDASTGTLTFNVEHFSTYFVNTMNAPVADAGHDRVVYVDEQAALDGSGSYDIDGDSLTYLWTQTSGDNVTLSDSTAQKPTFTPPSIGTYVFELIVNDGTADSSPDSVTITAEESDYGRVLDITKVKITSEDKDQELKPGEEFTVKVYIDNKKSFDVDIEDIELKLWFEDSSGNILEDDDGDELEDESEFDLDSGDDEGDVDEDVEFTFETPYDFEDGDTYTVYVTAQGYQSNDSSIIYLDKDTSKEIELIKEKHEIDIYKASVVPSTVACTRTATVAVGLRNIGEKVEDVDLKIESPELGINKLDSFEMDEDPDDDDNIYINSFNFNIADDVAEGVYPITIYVDYAKSKSQTLNLEVQECTKAVGIEEMVELRIPYLVTTPPTVGEAELIEPSVTKVSFRESSNYLVFLAISFIILTGAVIFAIGAVIITFGKK